ncbi:hypothetical protein QA601_07375 [Chitinispirillales bacterium ANBcel5]|uniref:hypothetical protein n=1 Tax=Cellulosispirillum alkaliphilum TaxID=3039283 RepID=UPI002A53F4DF|nr:hypothetical protein [Chitinispirillales bacterium ANBcel5]
MEETKDKLISLAKRQYKKIFPCSYRQNFNDCFTVYENYVLFWFNTEDQTTHVLKADMN